MKSILFLIAMALLCIIVATNHAYADETKRVYDDQHNAIGYTITDENGQESHFDAGWNRIGKTIYKNDQAVKYDLKHNRTGRIKWNGNNGTKFDNSGNRTGYLRKRGNKTIIYDGGWNRRGYKK